MTISTKTLYINIYVHICMYRICSFKSLPLIDRYFLLLLWLSISNHLQASNAMPNCRFPLEVITTTKTNYYITNKKTINTQQFQKKTSIFSFPVSSLAAAAATTTRAAIFFITRSLSFNFMAKKLKKKKKWTHTEQTYHEKMMLSKIHKYDTLKEK